LRISLGERALGLHIAHWAEAIGASGRHHPFDKIGVGQRQKIDTDIVAQVVRPAQFGGASWRRRDEGEKRRS